MLFEQAPVAYLSLDASGAIADVNPAWLGMTGLSRGECLGRQLTDYLQPESRRTFLEGFLQLTQKGGERVFEIQLHGVPASLTVVLALRAEQGLGGEFRIAHCVVFNITERKRYEDAVRVSEQRLSWALQVANDAIWEFCPRKGESYFSQRFGSLLGRDPRLPLDNLSAWRALVHPEDLALFEASFERFFEQGGELSFEHRVQHGDGHWLWLLCRGRVVECLDTGVPSRLIGTVSDITERKQAEEAVRESARKYRTYIDESPISILVLNSSGAVLEVNTAACQLFGVNRDGPFGDFVDQIVDPPSHEPARAFLLQLGKHGRAEVELRARRKNGVVVLLAVQATLISSSQFLLYCQDVTTRRRTELALKARESMLESILQTALDGFWILDTRGGILEVNQAYCESSGYSHKELLQLGLLDLEALEGPSQVQRHLERICRDGRDRWESSHKGKDGRLFDVEISANFLPVEEGRIVAFIQNITTRKRAENALRQSERRLSLIIEGSALAAWDWDLRTGEVLLNSHWSRMLGRGEGDQSMPLPSYEALIHPDDRKRVSEAMRQHVMNQSPYFDSEFRLSCQDGTWLWVMDRGQVIMRDSSGKALRATGTQRNVHARKVAETRVRQQAALLDQTLDLVLAADRGGRVLYGNQSACSFLSKTTPVLEGSLFWQLFPETDPCFDEALFHHIVQLGEWSGELRFQDGIHPQLIWDCRCRMVESDRDEPGMLLFVATDVSEKKMLEARFLRSQRMESIGALATGVAHDLNNIFLPITLASNMLRQSPTPEQQATLHAMLDQSAQRGADVVRQLLTFGKGLDGRRIELQPRMLIHEIRRIIAETFPRNITLECRAAENLWTIQADPTQIHQVLLNLCVNARDAMPEGGLLTITAENLFFDEYYATMNPDAEAGPYVVLQVGDSGVGIPLENQEKIFDPFFTTKELGQGTGLGLSTVHGIVKSHRGFIQVRSLPGQGAVFKVYIPAIPNVVEVGEEPASLEPPDGGGQLVMVVDDEDAVKDSLRHLLEGHGYRAVCAADGREAMVGFVQRKDEIAAIITDIMMPVMDGVELVRAVRRINPLMPVIAMSGLPEKENMANMPGVAVDRFLLKPFVSDQLLTALHEVLRPSSGGAGDLPNLIQADTNKT